MGVFRLFYRWEKASHIGDCLISVDYNGRVVIKAWAHETKSLKVVGCYNLAVPQCKSCTPL